MVCNNPINNCFVKENITNDGTITMYIHSNATATYLQELALFTPMSMDYVVGRDYMPTWSSNTTLDLENVEQGTVVTNVGNYLEASHHHHYTAAANLDRYVHLTVRAGVPIYFVGMALGVVTIKLFGKETTL